jgi:hypothetical protein
VPNSFFQPTNCEDCDARLDAGSGGDAMDMDVDMMIDIDIDGANFGCTSCGKTVCHGCAVSNLGEQRRCLVCAGPPSQKKWVGGIGWVDEA